LMGGFTLVVDGQPVPAGRFARRSAAALVQLLALQDGHRLHRERVMNLLWPEAGPGEAANALHKAAHYARRAAGDAQCVVLRQELVSLFPDRSIDVDVSSFEAAARGALAAADPDAAGSALALYGGELLPADA